MMRPRPLVVVTWLDAHALDPCEDHDTRTIVAKHEPLVSCTVGWLVRRDRKGVTVAAEHQPDADAEGGFYYRGLTFIPAGMIRRIKRVRA